MKSEKRNAAWRRHMLTLKNKAGAMKDRRTKRNRTRTEQHRRAIRDSKGE